MADRLEGHLRLNNPWLKSPARRRAADWFLCPYYGASQDDWGFNNTLAEVTAACLRRITTTPALYLGNLLDVWEQGSRYIRSGVPGPG